VKRLFLKLKTNQATNQSYIHKIDNFIPVIKTLKSTNKDTLVIFDVDDVLITSSNEHDFRHPYRIKLWQEIKDRLAPEMIETLHSNIISTAKKKLVEPRIAKMFSYLHLQCIPTIALTAMSTGKFGIIEKMEDLRIKELNNVGISFLPLTPLKGDVLAVGLENANMICSECKGIPMLKEGIILTAGIDKSIVLEYMFNTYNYYPKTIIFIDDSLKNIESLEKLCIKLKINFQGFHYTAVSLMSLPIIDEYLERLRFKILEQKHSWLSYTQLMKKKNSYNYSKSDLFLLLNREII